MLANQQLALFKPRGGKRRGAGRPPKGAKSGAPHTARPEFAARFPVHVVLRVARDVGNLRRKCTYLAIREATLTAARRAQIRIVHLSVQRTHVHMIVEAEGKRALAAGMQGFQVAAAKYLNKALGRRGAVFPDRYFAVLITSPRQARHVLAYVMGNWRKHGEDRGEKTAGWKIDWFSSAWMFGDWAEYGDEVWLWRGPATYEPLLVWRPRCWLLREGWKRHGGTLSCFDVPSA